MNNMLRLALFSLSLCAPVQAQDLQIADKPNVEIADALVCDTREQVERYIAFYKGDQEAAVRAVNREEGDRAACGVVNVQCRQRIGIPWQPANHRQPAPNLFVEICAPPF